MKRLLIIMIITGAITKVQAQSMLRVHLADNTQVNVEVDGRYFNKRGTGVTIGDLPPGRHRIKIYQLNQGRRGRGFEDVIYDGKVKTIYGMISLFEYDPSTGGISVQEQDINTYTNSRPQVNAQIQAHHEDNNGNSYAMNNADNGGAYSSPAVAGTLTESKIDMLKTKVAAKKTDTEKMNVLKDGLMDEKVTTSQVGAIMDWLNFESSKVDFAEWAYNNTVDKQYFSDLDAKFTYKNYQDDLDKFIQSKK